MKRLKQTQTTYDHVAGYNQLRTLWRKDPVLYARQRFGLNPTRQQAQLLRSIAAEGSKVTVRAGHGVGKTTALAIAIWWHMECFDRSKTPCTAPTAHQLRTILWSELRKTYRMANQVAARMELGPPAFSDLFKITIDRIDLTQEGGEWFVQGRTARRGETDALQGFHNSDVKISEDDVAIMLSESGGSLMFVVEEASGVEDGVFEVVQGALSSKRVRFIMVGNPTNTTGYFAKSHRENIAAFTAPLHFSCGDSPLTEPGYLATLERTWGKNSNVVRVRYYGDFPKQDDDVLIALEWTEAALNRDPITSTDRIVLGVDVARFGDDRTCLLVRQGRQILHIEIHTKEDTMMTAGRTIACAKRFNVNAIHVDEIGVGGGVVDRLNEQSRDLPGVSIVPVNVSDAATLREKTRDLTKNMSPRAKFGYQDMKPAKMKDYLWLEMADWYALEEPVLVTDDCEWRDHAQTLAAECATVKYRFDSSGRITVESKDDMKKRKLRSPDVAEALSVTFSPDRLSIWERLAG